MDRTKVAAGRPPKAQAEALANHVVAIADMLFIEKGYGGTSMATVASRAHVGKQSLYRRFPDKAALFREVIRRRIDRTIVSPNDSVAEHDPLNKLKNFGRSALENALDPEFVRLYRIVISEALPFPELASAALECWKSGFKDRCVDAIRQAQAIGMCKPGDPEALAQCFLWSLIGEAFLRGLSGQEYLSCEGSRDSHLERVWRVFLDGVSMAAGRTGQ
jgi:AcrR family transcriptional regulator